MPYDEREVRSIIRRVRRRFGEPSADPQFDRSSDPTADLGDGVFSSISAAVEAAQAAFEVFGAQGLEARRQLGLLQEATNSGSFSFIDSSLLVPEAFFGSEFLD